MIRRAFHLKKGKKKRNNEEIENNSELNLLSSSSVSSEPDGNGSVSETSSVLTTSTTDYTLGTVDDRIEAFLEVEKLGDIATQKNDIYQAKNSYEVALNLLRKPLKPDHPHLIRVREKLDETILLISDNGGSINKFNGTKANGRIDATPEWINTSKTSSNAPRDGIKKFFTNDSNDGPMIHDANSLEAIAHDYKHHKNIGQKSLQYHNANDALFHYNQMLTLIRRAEGVDEDTLGSYGILLSEAQILDIIGEVHALMKNKEGALTAFTESIQIRKAQGKDKIARSATHHKIGRIYESMEDYTKAQKHYKKSIKLKKQNHKELIKNIFNVDSAINVSSTYGEQGDDISSQQSTVYNRMGIQLARKESYQEALEFFHTSVVNLSNSKGDHADIDAMTYNNIGNAYANTLDDDDLDTPLEYYLMALKSSTSKEPYVKAGALYNCGLLYVKKGFNEKGKICFEDALTCFEKGKDFSQNEESRILISLIMNNMGNLVSEEGNIKEASQYYKDALKMKIAAFGDDSEQNIGTLCNAGVSMFKLKEYDQAYNYFERALKIIISRRKKGNDLQHANILSQLGNICARKKDYVKAYDFYTKSLTIKRKVIYDTADDDILKTLNIIANILYKQRKWDQSIRTFTTVYNRKITKYGEETMETGKILLDTAYAQLKKGDFVKAKELYKRVIVIFDEIDIAEDHKYFQQLQRLQDKLEF